jgi:hypothetical protein
MNAGQLKEAILKSLEEEMENYKSRAAECTKAEESARSND